MNNIPIKPKDAQWTDAQWNSIYAKGQDILVAKQLLAQKNSCSS